MFTKNYLGINTNWKCGCRVFCLFATFLSLEFVSWVSKSDVVRLVSIWINEWLKGHPLSLFDWFVKREAKSKAFWYRKPRLELSDEIPVTQDGLPNDVDWLPKQGITFKVKHWEWSVSSGISRDNFSLQTNSWQTCEDFVGDDLCRIYRFVCLFLREDSSFKSLKSVFHRTGQKYTQSVNVSVSVDTYIYRKSFDRTSQD